MILLLLLLLLLLQFRHCFVVESTERPPLQCTEGGSGTTTARWRAALVVVFSATVTAVAEVTHPSASTITAAARTSTASCRAAVFF